MLTQERLKELLEYDPETGDFWWRVDYGGRTHKGDYAGKHNTDGYLQIGVDCRLYMAHRLAWLYMTGEWPSGEIDHINRKRDDNKWENIREATNGQNRANSKLARNSTSGFKGVSWYPRYNKYLTRIMFNEKSTHIGYFASPEEAARAYDKKAVELFGEYACLNFPEPSNIET